MKTRPYLILSVLIMLMMFSSTSQVTAQDSNPTEPQAVVGPTFTYQGYLEDNGLPANGQYDFAIKLYDAASAGSQVGGTASLGDVDVVDGYFTVQPDFVSNPMYIYTGQALWLEIRVRPGASGGSYTTLTPRQPLTATPYAFSLVPGATIDVEYNYSDRGIINVTNRSTDGFVNGLSGSTYSTGGGKGVMGITYSTTGTGYGVYGVSNGDTGTGVRGYAASTTGITYGVYGWARSSSGYGVYGEAPTFGVYGYASATDSYTYGLYGESVSSSGTGVFGIASATGGNTRGVYGTSASSSGIGVYGLASGGGSGVMGEAGSSTGRGVYGAGATGVYGSSALATGYGVHGYAGAFSGGTRGVYGEVVSSAGIGVLGYATATEGSSSGVYGQTDSPDGRGTVGYAASASGASRGVYGRANSAGGFGGYFYNSGGGVALLAESETASGDVLRIYGSSGSDIEFRVTGNGNAYADGTFTPGGADLAEMLPAVEGLQPGELLVIGLDGKLTRSTQAYQATVVGVYSTQPGFLGGAGDGEDLTGKVPLAIAGVVPVKVSAENGAIQPGDLLTASSTPGYAMKASPITVNGFTFYPSGVVIGKALEGLDAGTGVILVLVTLQ